MPIGAVFLALLVGYGLMEFIGVLVQPIMRPIFKTPGRSAVDAVASFVGSYSLRLLITNRVYKGGRYTGREAAIIGVGFSTVSATFMVVVANTLDLMQHWNLFFWSTLVITFAVTAITVHVPRCGASPTSTTRASSPTRSRRSPSTGCVAPGGRAVRWSRVPRPCCATSWTTSRTG